jgi:hypothetical protein
MNTQWDLGFGLLIFVTAIDIWVIMIQNSTNTGFWYSWEISKVREKNW